MIRRVIRCQGESTEPSLATMTSKFPEGFEQLDGDGWVEFAVYGAEQDLLGEDALRELFGDDLISITARPVAADWTERWKEFHQPAIVDDAVVIRPPWTPAPESGHIDIVIDPGQAFGTGSHPTTRMCASLMLVLFNEGSAVGDFADLGCGSGVLSILASRLGYGSVAGVDNDRVAIAAAQQNAFVNRAAAEFELRDVLSDGVPPAGTAVANLNATLLAQILPVIADSEAQRLIVSGLLAEEAVGFGGPLADAGMAMTHRRDEGGWAAMLFERDTAPGQPTTERDQV